MLKEYIATYQKYNLKQNDYAEFSLFVKGLKDKIEKCLETQVALSNIEKKWFVKCLDQSFREFVQSPYFLKSINQYTIPTRIHKTLIQTIFKYV